MKKLFCLLAALALLAQPLRAAEEPKCYLALTFDDGPSGELTERLLEGLAERQVHATFFVCGYRIAEFPDTLSHIAAAGHEIGLHSSNHDYMQKMDYETALRDLTGCAKAVEDACGVQARLFRPPGGLYGDTLLRAEKTRGCRSFCGRSTRATGTRPRGTAFCRRFCPRRMTAGSSSCTTCRRIRSRAPCRPSTGCRRRDTRSAPSRSWPRCAARRFCPARSIPAFRRWTVDAERIPG